MFLWQITLDFIKKMLYNDRQNFAGMMELADVPDSKSGPGNRVRVQVPLPAPKQKSYHESGRIYILYYSLLSIHQFRCE